MASSCLVVAATIIFDLIRDRRFLSILLMVGGGVSAWPSSISQKEGAGAARATSAVPQFSVAAAARTIPFYGGILIVG